MAVFAQGSQATACLGGGAPPQLRNSVRAHPAGRGEQGTPPPCSGCWGRGSLALGSEPISFLVVPWPWCLCPFEGSFVVICNRGGRRACVPRGEGAEGWGADPRPQSFGLTLRPRWVRFSASRVP